MYKKIKAKDWSNKTGEIMYWINNRVSYYGYSQDLFMANMDNIADGVIALKINTTIYGQHNKINQIQYNNNWIEPCIDEIKNKNQYYITRAVEHRVILGKKKEKLRVTITVSIIDWLRDPHNVINQFKKYVVNYGITTWSVDAKYIRSGVLIYSAEIINYI